MATLIPAKRIIEVNISVNDSIASATSANELPKIPAVPFIITSPELDNIPISVVLALISPASFEEYFLLMSEPHNKKYLYH